MSPYAISTLSEFPNSDDLTDSRGMNPDAIADVVFAHAARPDVIMDILLGLSADSS